MEPFIQKVIQKRIDAIREGNTSVLDLRKLSLRSIPNEVFGEDGITELYLNTDNKITESNLYLSEEYWWEVQHDNNTIGSLPADVVKLKQLEIIDLSGNDLHTLPKELGQLENLRELYLQNNCLATLPDSIVQLVNLEVLDLSYNSLENLPEDFNSLKKLRVLNLNSNALTRLPDSIGNLSNLEVLNIGNYDSNRIDPEVVECFQLQQNKFQYLPSSLVGLKKLQEVNIIGCGLPKIMEESVEWGIDGFLEMLR
ncbi:MAG: leucine-rich repeat domain-containing protein [Salinivirgaceae bacterium]